MRLYEDRPSGTIARARQLRREASEPEHRLLRALREGLGGYKWRHQAPMGDFYADILCYGERLVIEVDGDTHADTARYDAERTGFLNRQGFHVLRFTNADVMENVEGVVTSISLSLREREGGAKRRKGEVNPTRAKGERRIRRSPSPRAAARLAPLPRGEGI